MKKLPFILLGLLLLALLPAPAGAQDGAAVEMTATAGFDGIYKEGAWVPIQVSVANSGPAIEGELRVVTGLGPSNEVAYTSPLSLPTQSDKRVTLYVYVPNLTDRLVVELLDERGDPVAGVETNRMNRLEADGMLYGVVQPDLTELGFLEDVVGNRATAAVALLDVADLPAVGAAWRALDVLVVAGVDTGRMAPAQITALERWVSTGGTLVVTGGPNWQQTTAALSHLLPVAVDGSRTVEDLPALRAFAGEDFRDPGPYVVATGSLQGGTLVLYQDALPLLARQGRGRGAVYFLALDPAVPPLLDWDGHPRIWEEIAATVPPQPLWAEGARNSYAAGSAVTRLSSLSLPPAGWLALFLLIYVIVVGPGNYLILKRLGRRELAWLTIPATILIFSVLVTFTGFRLRGNAVITNQMSIAYGPAGGDTVRAQTLLGLYSPRRATYNVTLPDSVLVRPFDRGYGSLAGSGNQEAVARGSDVVLEGVRVDVSGVETYVAESYHPAPAVSGQATLRLDGSDAYLDVTVQNSGDRTLDNAGLLFGSSFIPLGDLAPGASRSESKMLTAAQASVTAGTTAVGAPGFVGVSGGAALNAYYGSLLGTTNYYNDLAVYARFQLLESLAGYGRPDPGTIPAGTVTLIAWTDEAQLDVTLGDVQHDDLGTTLYFLELPFADTIAGGQGVSVPKALLNWRVLAQDGVYEPTITDLYLSQGWVELEFTPWPAFQPMAVTGLEIALTRPDESASVRTPDVRLWDWERETWAALGDPAWGRMTLADPAPYVGPQNAVRIRLQNSATTGVNVHEIYPVLTGNLE